MKANFQATDHLSESEDGEIAEGVDSQNTTQPPSSSTGDSSTSGVLPTNPMATELTPKQLAEMWTYFQNRKFMRSHVQ